MTSQVKRLPPAARRKARIFGYSLSLVGVAVTITVAVTINWRLAYVTGIPILAGPAVEWALFLNRSADHDRR